MSYFKSQLCTWLSLQRPSYFLHPFEYVTPASRLWLELMKTRERPLWRQHGRTRGSAVAASGLVLLAQSFADGGRCCDVGLRTWVPQLGPLHGKTVSGWHRLSKGSGWHHGLVPPWDGTAGEGGTQPPGAVVLGWHLQHVLADICRVLLPGAARPPAAENLAKAQARSLLLRPSPAQVPTWEMFVNETRIRRTMKKQGGNGKNVFALPRRTLETQLGGNYAPCRV